MKEGDTLNRIDSGVTRIRKRLRLNTWIFATTGILSVITAAVVIWLVVQGVKLSAAQQVNYQLAKAAIEQNANVKAKLEASDELYMNYIKATVGQILDKLQKDNPKIKVPKAPLPRPPGLPPVSEVDLERPASERPKPPPTPATLKPIHHYRSRPSPTPRPWYNFFQTH